MKTKKGTFFHWIVVLGIPLAVGIFLLLTFKPGTVTSFKGQWPLDFLGQSFLPAEKELLKIDLAAREAGLKTAVEMAGQGGILGDSECGKEGEFNFWNKRDRYCFPEVGSVLGEIFNQKFKEIIPEFKEIIPDRTFSEVSFEGYSLYGKGESQIIEVGGRGFKRYIYETSFGVELGYSFEEYKELEEEARRLLGKCRGSEGLISCLKENKKENWKDNFCEGEELAEGEKISFCVISGSEPLIKYKFGLDFGEVETSGVEGLKVEKISEGYKISFKKKEEGESYKLYYTNWGVEGKKGKTRDIFLAMPKAEEFGYFYKEIGLVKPTKENCPTEKSKGEAYLCGEEVVYILDGSGLKEEGYWFGVAVKERGGEGEIKEWVKV